MPIIKSAIKRVKQAAKRRSLNLQVKRAVHNDIRAFENAVAAQDIKAVANTLREAISEVDRALKKGTIHRNTAGRRKSKLQKSANSVIAPTKSGKSAPKAKSPAKAKPAPKAVAKTPKAKPAAKPVAKKAAAKKPSK